jgi:hypothetical protein
MYVDESGDDVMDQSKWSSPDARYLGLTGVVIASEAYRTRIHTEFEALKQEFFPHDPDDPVILVRSEIVKKWNIFRTLQDPEIAAHWEERIIRFLDLHVDQVITVVLDKGAFPPTGQPLGVQSYGYCMEALTGIYDQWLSRVGGTGDVMAESRGKKEDRQLKKDFHKFMTGEGTAQDSSRSVSSNQIKLNRKSDNITGLQLADLLAYPSKRGILLDNGRILDNPPSSATLRFINAVRPKTNPPNSLLP